MLGVHTTGLVDVDAGVVDMEVDVEERDGDMDEDEIDGVDEGSSHPT